MSEHLNNYRYFISDERAAHSILQWRMKPDDFTIIKTIGRGAFGEVELVIF